MFFQNFSDVNIFIYVNGVFYYLVSTNDFFPLNSYNYFYFKDLQVT